MPPEQPTEINFHDPTMCKTKHMEKPPKTTEYFKDVETAEEHGGHFSASERQ